ncbi:MAG: small-conductance mechanosensitive channel [Verrucomicrobiales bacterium]|jgi:small-conductance mechanosensitive channel
MILDDPAPSAAFLCLGASSLDFELRVHITGADDLIRVRSQLHDAINPALKYMSHLN